MKAKELSFEGAMTRLEEIIQQLEGGEAELDQTLSLFEEGVKLSKQCQKKLEMAEKKIEVLVKKEGNKLERESAENSEHYCNYEGPK